jgi:hypothetical protein
MELRSENNTRFVVLIFQIRIYSIAWSRGPEVYSPGPLRK